MCLLWIASSVKTLSGRALAYRRSPPTIAWFVAGLLTCRLFNSPPEISSFVKRSLARVVLGPSTGPPAIPWFVNGTLAPEALIGPPEIPSFVKGTLTGVILWSPTGPPEIP